MAKMKLKLDWKGLLAAHGEKLVAALVAVMVLLVIWNGIGREQLEANKSPEAMMKKVDDAKRNITITKWNAFKQRPELKDYSNRSIMDKIALSPYVTKKAYDNPIHQFKVRRDDPQLLTVGELETHAGFGAFAVVEERKIEIRRNDPTIEFLKPQVHGEKGGSGRGMFDQRSRDGYIVNEGDLLKGIRYAIVTGLVPMAQQQDEYNAVFQPAIGYDPHNDVPIYVGYVVERRDVAEDGSGSEWSRKMVFQPVTLREAAIAWAGTLPEVVQEKYTMERLTYPLGPLVLRNWGREVAHSKVALGGRQAQTQVEPRPAPRQEPKGDDIEFGNNRPRPRLAPQPEEKKQEDIDVKLLRYFDFEVEPGKRYQYRFQLVLRDPNTIRERATGPAPPAGAAAQLPAIPNTMLKQDVIDRIKNAKNKSIRFTGWSEPSPVVAIPYDNRLLVGEIVPATKTTEALVTVMVKAFDIEKGTEIVGKEKFARGSVVRFKQDVTIVDPRSGKPETIEQYNFDPQAIVLDIRGGKRIELPPDVPGGKRKALSLDEPGEVLIQDQTGRLVVHSELADALEIKQSEPSADKARDEAPAPNAFLGGAAPPPAKDAGKPSGKASNKDSGIDTSGLIDTGTPKKRPKKQND